MPEDRLIAGRYRIVRLLGRGGNALVHEVIDEGTGTRMALKALASEEAGRQHVRDLFRREFNTLAQLTHPLIVRVFDYGVDETPYYTMELLSGKSVRGPIGWAEACALLRDVASALSLVHSRRLVHRDVTHKNVFRTEDGRGKLIDFGALSPMGPATDVVGTPAYIPPEAIAEQRLDARSDLFSLGALAYHLLTGRHAFPARRITDLGDAWRRTVERPSFFAPDVPKALDDLVMSLISIKSVARPSSAAEVFDRLTAIASLPVTEAPEVAQAYLTTPALVGRAASSAHFTRILARVRQGRGTSFLLEGQRGLGRSRLLSSLLLDAKLEGLLTFRVDGTSGESEPFGVARALARQLFLADPVAARDAAGSNAELLAKILFADREQSHTFTIEDASASMVEALAAMITAAARATPIVIGVDDFERVDAFSKQVLIRIAGAAHKSAVVLVVALVQDIATEAHGLLRGLSQAAMLPPLSEIETRQLVGSLFGEVAHVEAVGSWVHRLSGGHPRTALEAATHLVDSTIARFVEGSWVLPRSLDDVALPASIEQALDARIFQLGADARGLCHALALSSAEDPLVYDEYTALAPNGSGRRLDAALNELIARSVLVPASNSFAFVREGMRQAALCSIPDGGHAEIHRMVAAAYASGKTPSFFLAAHHCLQAGDVDTGFAYAARAVTQNRTIETRGVAFLRTVEGTDSMSALFEWGLANGKRWPDVIAIGQFLLQQAAVGDMRLVRYRDPVIARLKQDSGLLDWEELSSVDDAFERVRTAVGRAFVRHESTPESERGVAPLAAIEMLCGAAAGLTGLFARRGEAAEVRSLLSLLEPFEPISKAVAVVADIVRTTADSVLARSVRDARLRAIEVLSAPVDGLHEVSRVGTYWINIYYQALDDALHGRPGAAAPVSVLARTATYAPLAWEARMLEALYQGDSEGAEINRKERDFAKLTLSDDFIAHLDGAFPYEAAVCEHLGDLLGLKRCLPWFEERSRTYPMFKVSYELHLGNYHRLRGELPKALAAYERALSHAPAPDVHFDYVNSALRYGQALLEYGRTQESLRFLEQAVSVCRAHGVTWLTMCLLELALAAAEASSGNARMATARSERVRALVEENGLGGIMLVTIYKEQARVAELAGDDALLERSISRIERVAARSKYPAFATKHAHLLRHTQGRSKFEVAPNPQTSLGGSELTHTSLVVGLRTQIELCRGRSERAQKALRILQDAASSDEGFLFLCNADKIVLAASTRAEPPPPSLEAALSERIRLSTGEEDSTSESTLMKSLRPMELGERFDVVEVITQTGGRVVLAALAALKPRKEILDPVPMTVRSALSDALLTAGDASGIPWV